MRSLFLGQIEDSLVHPFPPCTSGDDDTLALVVDSFRRFAARNIDPDRIDREARYPREILRGLGEIGLLGLTVPEEYGGLGMTQTAFSRVMEVVSGVDAATAVTVGAHLGIGIKGILKYGTPEQRSRFLPGLASGELIAAYALTEPEAGSDAHSIQATARLSSDRQSFILNGTKMWITNGGFADLFTVFARSGEDQRDGTKRARLTAFLVTRDTPGVSTGRDEDKLGIRGSSTTTVTLDQVRVPIVNVLGEEGRGFKVALEVLNDGRVSLAAGCIGLAKSLLRGAQRAARERRAFGRAIADFEMIQHKVGWMATQIYVMESMVYLTAAMVDGKRLDYSLESAACKIYCTERTWEIASEAMQIAGGNGFMRGLPYERVLRDARVNLIFEGTNEVLRAFVALSGIQQLADYLKNISALKGVSSALQDPLETLGVLSDFATKKIRRVVAPESMTGLDPRLRKASRRLSDAVVVFAEALEYSLRHYRKDIVDRQFIQKRAAEMACDIYAMVATLSRTDSLLRSRAAEKTVAVRRMCNLFVERAWRRVRRNARRIDFDSDAPLAEIAREVYENDGYRA